MDNVTVLQIKYLKFIRGRIKETRYPPSVLDMTEAFFVGRKTVYKALHQLKKNGLIDWETNDMLTIRLTAIGVDLLNNLEGEKRHGTKTEGRTR